MKKRCFLALAFVTAAIFTACENQADGTEEPGTSKEITAFSIDGTAGIIDADNLTVVVTLPGDSLPDLTSLKPEIVHNGASMDPEPGAASNFYLNGFTPVVYTVTAADGSAAEWNVTVKLAPLAAGADIAAYIGGAEGWGGEDRPVPLTLDIGLADGWAALLSAIEGAGKYVALDLSACTMAGTEFDPGEADTGESLIVSLVLPDAAESIKAGKPSTAYVSNSTFAKFTRLKSVGGKNITDIGDYTFRECVALSTVNFPAAESIGQSAFSNTALSTLNFPAATSIGNSAFRRCGALLTVSLPAAKSINSYAFNHCPLLQTVDLPVATDIGLDAFGRCDSLSTVNLPAATNIGNDAFVGCDSLQTVSLPAATSIGSSFKQCSALKTVDLPAATNIGDSAFRYCDSLQTVSLPAATSIGSLAFSDCPSLKTVNLPAAEIIGIGYGGTYGHGQTFAHCNALETVNLPAATKIYEDVFLYTYGDTALTINLPAAAPVVAENGHDDYYDYSFTKSVTVKIPSGATGYSETWQTNFKKSFGTDSGITINLTVEEGD